MKGWLLRCTSTNVYKYLKGLERVDAGCENSEEWKIKAEENYNGWKPHFKQLNNFAFDDVLYSFFCEVPAMKQNNKGCRFNSEHLYSMRTPNHKGKSVDQYMVPIVALSKRDTGKPAFLKTEVLVVALSRSPQYFLAQSSMSDKLLFVHLCGHANCFSPLHLRYEKVEITAERTACQENLDSCDHLPTCVSLANQVEAMVFQVKEKTVAKSK